MSCLGLRAASSHLTPSLNTKFYEKLHAIERLKFDAEVTSVSLHCSSTTVINQIADYIRMKYYASPFRDLTDGILNLTHKAAKRYKPYSHLLHRLLLGRGADPGDGEADVDGGADALVEELRLQEDLAVRDRDDVGRDVGGHVAGLRLDDGQSRQRAAAHRVGHLGSPLKKPNSGQTVSG